jgi:hypothetical protein
MTNYDMRWSAVALFSLHDENIQHRIHLLTRNRVCRARRRPFHLHHAEGSSGRGADCEAGGCAPKDNTARILKSAHPLDLAPNWTGTNYIGTGWTFMPKRYVVDPDLTGGVYLEGNLITTRGAAMPDDLFILYAEWDCAGK